MRIIAGKHRGRVLKTFRGQDVRPTADRVKESLFQILSARLAGARVLDLFCGSGALGLEALSRGAAQVVFNDASQESLAIVRGNLALLRESGEIMNKDYAACLCSVEGKFDLIFADPPYREEYTQAILSAVSKRELLNPHGLVIVESERDELCPPKWTVFDQRSYGRTKITMFTRSDE